MLIRVGQSVGASYPASAASHAVAVTKPLVRQLLLAAAITNQSAGTVPTQTITDNGANTGWNVLSVNSAKVQGINSWVSAWWRPAVAADVSSLTSVTFHSNQGAITTGGSLLFEEYDGFFGVPVADVSGANTQDGIINDWASAAAMATFPELAWGVLLAANALGALQPSFCRYQINFGGATPPQWLLTTSNAGASGTCQPGWGVVNQASTASATADRVEFAWTNVRDTYVVGGTWYDSGKLPAYILPGLQAGLPLQSP